MLFTAAELRLLQRPGGATTSRLCTCKFCQCQYQTQLRSLERLVKRLRAAGRGIPPLVDERMTYYRARVHGYAPQKPGEAMREQIRREFAARPPKRGRPPKLDQFGTA